MRNKLGLLDEDNKDKFLIVDLLTWMHSNKVDYTNTFCYLMSFEIQKDKKYFKDDFQNWLKRWKERLKTIKNNQNDSMNLMRSFNPLVIPRNHKVEEALDEANKDNLEPVNKLLKILKEPYSEKNDNLDFQIPDISRKDYKTFCGT